MTIRNLFLGYYCDGFYLTSTLNVQIQVYLKKQSMFTSKMSFDGDIFKKQFATNNHSQSVQSEVQKGK